MRIRGAGVGRSAPLVLVAFGVVAAACTGSPAPGPATPVRSSASSVPVCRPEFRPPAAFAERGTFTVPQSDHVGTRVSYADARGRVLVFASGITGEFGEGEPVAGTLTVNTGDEARLLGGASTWFLVWSDGAPCASMAVIGRGMARAQFLRLLQRSGVVAPGS